MSSLRPTGSRCDSRFVPIAASGDGESTLLGQIGDGSTISRDNPVAVLNVDGSPFTDVVAVSAGATHTLALKSDGSVWAWGTNESGQLGDGTTTTRARPVRVRDASGPLTGVVAIAAGGVGGMALRQDGTVLTWGDNTFGQLGNNTTVARPLAAPVPGCRTWSRSRSGRDVRRFPGMWFTRSRSRPLAR